MRADDVFAILNKKIKNIADSFGNGSTAPTKTSELTNDSGFVTEDSIPKKVSDLENDSNFLTEHQDLSDYAKKEYVDSAKNSILLIDTETGTTYALQVTNGQIAIAEVTSE